MNYTHSRFRKGDLVKLTHNTTLLEKAGPLSRVRVGDVGVVEQTHKQYGHHWGIHWGVFVVRFFSDPTRTHDIHEVELESVSGDRL